MSYTRGNEIATIDCQLVTVEDASSNVYGLNTASKIEVNPVTETTDAVKLIIKGALIAQKGATTVVTGNTIVLTDNVFNPQLVKLLQGGTITYAQTYTNTVPASGLTAAQYYFQIASLEYVSFTLASSLASGDTIVYNDVTGELIVTSGGVSTKASRTISVDAPALATELTMVATSDTGHVKQYMPPASGSITTQEVFTLRAYSAIYNAAAICTGYECIEYPNCKGVPVALSSEDDVFRVPQYTINSAPNTGEAPYTVKYTPNLPTVSV